MTKSTASSKVGGEWGMNLLTHVFERGDSCKVVNRP